MRFCALLMVLSSASFAADQCTRDSDCGSGKTCIANRCTASREQEAAVGAGMALQYTKNTWPMSIVDRPLVVAPGMTEAQVAIGKDLSADLGASNPLHPLGMGVYARYGVSDRIHAGLDVLTLCVSDCGPTGTFSGLSVGAGYAVVATRDMNLVPALTMSITNVISGADTTLTVGINPGFLFGYRVNQALQILASGGFSFPVTSRDASSDTVGLHVEPRFELMPQFSVGPYIGYTYFFKGIPDGLGGTQHLYFVPAGVNLLYIVTRTVDLGGSFEMNDISARLPGTSWSDHRSFTLFGTFRL
jgi:hypothetical protein